MMSAPLAAVDCRARGPAWKWWACSLLLLATMINYMDRLTLNQTAKRAMTEVGFDERGYGELESVFAYAFALGAVLAGWLADRCNIRWLYPAVLLAWSAAGFATGLTHGFLGLLACRFLLGLAEAGHWPCALRTTQHLLTPAQRPLGNSILQSGAALGAVFTPLLILALPKTPGTWRYPFLLVGCVGLLWVCLWLASVRSSDLKTARATTSPAPVGLLVVLALLFGVKNAVRWIPEVPSEVLLAVSVLVSAAGIAAVFRWLLGAAGEDADTPRATFFRRFWVLVIVAALINATWHFFRAWLPLFLQDRHSYSEGFMNWFMLAYYVATDVGSLTAGFAAVALSRRGFSVHGSRLTVFAACAALCTLGTVAAFLPGGPVLLGVLLVLGFAALGLFGCYYSLGQELSLRHQGKVTGALSCCCWLAMAPVHEAVGDVVKQTGSYAEGMAAAGLAPLVGFAILALFWVKQPLTDVRSPVETTSSRQLDLLPSSAIPPPTPADG